MRRGIFRLYSTTADKAFPSRKADRGVAADEKKRTFLAFLVAGLFYLVLGNFPGVI
jgi:hypothetical protein